MRMRCGAMRCDAVRCGAAKTSIPNSQSNSMSAVADAANATGCLVQNTTVSNARGTQSSRPRKKYADAQAPTHSFDRAGIGTGWLGIACSRKAHGAEALVSGQTGCRLLCGTESHRM